jgi:hypothetical protein
MPEPTDTPRVHRPTLAQRDWYQRAGMLAGTSWFVATVIALIDAFRDDFPTPLTILALAVASVITAMWIQLWVGYQHQSTTAADHELLLVELRDNGPAVAEALGALAAQVESLAARVTAADVAFEYGRRYRDSVDTGSPVLRAVPSEN